MRLRLVAAAGGVALGIGLGGGAHAAPSCTLTKGKGPAVLAERNLDYAGKALPGRSSEILSLRAQLQTLAQKGEVFAAKAAPIERECRVLHAEVARLKAAKEKLEADRKPSRDRLAALKQTWDQTVVPRKRALEAELASYRAAGCGRTFKMPDERAAYERCEAWKRDHDSKSAAHGAEAGRIENEMKEIRLRLQAQAEEFDKAYQAALVRNQRYQAYVKGYQAERAAWEGEVRPLLAKSNALVVEANQRREALQKLNGQVAGIQEALRRLNKSMLSDASQRAEWEKATQEAMKNAWDRGKGMFVDEGLGVLGKRLENQLSGMSQELQRAVTQLSGEKDPARRERLHAAIKLMGRQRDEIRRARELVVDRLGDAKKLIDTADYAVSDAGDLEKSLKGAFTIVTTTLGDPKVQQALKVGGGYAAGVGHAQSIVESSYDITSEIVAWKRINQLNRNSDDYLKAVDRLKGNMEKTVQKIRALEKEGK